MFLIRGIARQVTRATSGVRSPGIYPISNWQISPTDVWQQSFLFSYTLISENFCLRIIRSKPSGNLLIDVPEIYEIKGPALIFGNFHVPEIQISPASVFDETNWNLPLSICSKNRFKQLPSTKILNSGIDWLLQESLCSKNFVELFTSTKTFKYEKVDTPAPTISEDLVSQLNIPRIFGKCFEHSNEGKELDGKNVQSKQHKKGADKIPTRTPSEWDLLHPMLLAPLSLEFPKEFDFYRELHGYQQSGISWLADSSSALLADEMGTGKTVQAVNALRLLFRQGKIRAALIVSPPAVIGSVDLTIETGNSEGWSGHLYHWASELEVAVMRGGSPDQRKLAWERPFHVYITTYDTLRTDIGNQTLSDLGKFDCILLDEAQKIKNQDSKTSKAIRSLQSEYRWALTGTPIENKLDDIKSLFAFIRPGTFIGGVEDSLDMIKETIDPFMLRRLKKDVLQDLPAKVRQETWMELDKEQRADYDIALKAGKEKIKKSLGTEKTTQVRTHIFALLVELKQICNFAKGKSDSPKIELLLEYLETISTNGQKVLVFSQYREEGTDKIAKALERKGIKYVLYTGKVTTQQKDQAVRDFREDPEITVFLATIDTAGYGITLTEATYVVHFDHPWNPAKMQNAEDRCHRIGQQLGVTIYSFWMRDTVEERIKKKLVEKHLLVENTVDDLAVEAIENAFSDEDWLDVFGVKPTIRSADSKSKSVDTAQPSSDTEQTPKSKNRPVQSSNSKSSPTTKKHLEVNQMSNQRISQLEENMELLRTQIAGKEKAKILGPLEEYARIELGIQELRKQLRPFEEEYWQLLAKKADRMEITDIEAEPVLTELLEQIPQLKTNKQFSDEMLQILQKIYVEVNKPGAPAGHPHQN
jgi:SNF2-related domain/Helicase conserved C-terminal domain